MPKKARLDLFIKEVTQGMSKMRLTVAEVFYITTQIQAGVIQEMEQLKDGGSLIIAPGKFKVTTKGNIKR